MEGGESVEDNSKSDDKMVKKEGWVLKQGPPPWKTWKKRWLVLTPTGLSYFSPKGKENKFSLKGSVPATMIATVELMAINKKKGIFGFKVDVPTRTYIFAPQPEKLQLSEKEAQGWRKQVQKVGTLTKKKKKREEKRMLTNPSHAQALYLPLTFFEPSRLQSVSQELEPLSPRAEASARMSRSQPPPTTSSSAKKGSSRHSREKEKEGESKERDRGDREREKKEDKDRKPRHRTGSKDKRSPEGGAKSDGKGRTSERERAKSELKRIDEERKAEIEQVVEKYLKKRDAIIDALVAKEISLIVESHEHEKQAILAQIRVKSIQL
ncbi:PH domain containing protein [Acanthamoeba castellanii str. Neff]|uniref:PH domain containing protein n=1 Tax=Acanthamoeba castellanii (strain ATCC 30010 / Neff) TaxID=1257118 RepID=L8H5X7_ACACF|nr:PH domain containing protein [Acanthamoeba castellanii str. Neff]ELR20128.1 PH domain containing protein [Acanthamoeba castellanii str. Neff]